MAYADQQMSGNKIAALIIAGIIHVAVIYALVTGLSYSSIKKAIERVTTVDVEEPPPPTETPPPPPKDLPPPPPIVAPPPPISIATAAPPIAVVPKAEPIPQVIPIARPPAPPPPPAPVQPNPVPRGNPQTWITTDDYPPSAMRREEEGTTRFTVTVGTNGRVESCSITGSSGHDDLDQATCRLVTSRGRFNAAKDSSGAPMSGTWSYATRWQIPKQ